MEWDTYFNFLCSNGATEKERIINQAKYDLIYNHKSSLSNKSIYINEIEHNALILSMNTNSSVTNEKKIIMMPGDCIHLGDYVVWDNHEWIVTDVNDDKEISYSGKIEKCNAILKFQDSEGKVYSYQAVRKSNTGSNTKTSEYVEIISGNCQFYVPFNSETSKIAINKRFMLWNQGETPEVYKLIGITPIMESISSFKTGYFIFTMERDVYNPNTDNVDLMIADYFDSPEEAGEEIILSCEKDEVIIGGSKVNIKSSKENCEWKLIAFDGYEQYFHIEHSGYDCWVWCDENYDLIGQSIKVICFLDDINSELMFKVVSRI